MIIGKPLTALRGGGLMPIINVTGVAQTDAVTCTKADRNYSGKWISNPNPAYDYWQFIIDEFGTYTITSNNGE